MSTILSVQNLSVQYKNQSCCSVNSLSFDLKKERHSVYMEILGCGKARLFGQSWEELFYGRYRYRKDYV
ncbi:MAG: hypothetical protein ACLSCV_11070 [Acutalibacteraceae bacterium]